MITRLKQGPGTAEKRSFRMAAASAVDVIGDALRNYKANGDTNQAAAIALYAILSLIPLFILTVLVVSAVFSHDPTVKERLLLYIRQFVPSFSGDLLVQLGRIETKREIIGSVGVASLLWLAALIFGAIEKSLHVIFRARKRRKYIISKLLGLAMIPFGWLVGMASISISYLAALVADQPILAGYGLWLTTLLRGFFIPYLLPYLVTVLYFTLMYKVIPTERIPLSSALLGGSLFAALMMAATWFFAWYVARYTRYDIIFGSLEAVVVVVVWIFYLAIIFLFCGEVNSSHQRRDAILIEKAIMKTKGHLIHERLYLKFGRLYEDGQYVFREGDKCQEFFYLISGRVQLEKGEGSLKKIVAVVGPGDYFGEMAALTLSERAASARCLTQCHIAAISADVFVRLLRESADLSLFMLREFSRRLRRTSNDLEDVTRRWLRLAAVLYLIGSWDPSAERSYVQELARITGTKPEELEEILSDLSKEGVLAIRDGALREFDREAAISLGRTRP